jgi:hypothetical protein
MLEVAVAALRGCSFITDVTAVTDLETPEGVRHIADQGGFVANLFAGLETCADAEYAVVSTADMPHLTPASVQAFVEAALPMKADLVYPVVPVDVCSEAYPGMRRTSLPTREGRFTGGNIVLMRPAAILRSRAHIEAAHAARKSPLRLAMMLGLGVAAGVAVSLLTGRGLLRIASLETAVGRLIGASARALVSGDPILATDVDRPEDVAVLRQLA